MCPISLPIRIIHHNSQLHDVKGWDSLQCINNSSTNHHHSNTTSTISNSIRSDINDRNCVENTNTTINNNKHRFDTVGNNIQFGFQDVCNDNNVITHEALSHSIGSVVNVRDRVGNTNTCIDNNKKSFDEVGNNIQIGLQDVYLNNNVINHESLRNSVGSGVNEQDSVGNTNAGVNNKKRGSMKLGIIFSLKFETFTIIIKFLIRNHFVIALEMVYMIETVLGIRIHLLIIIKEALMKLEIIFRLDCKTFTIIIML